MVSPSTDPVGVEILETLAQTGFDYIELSLADLAALPDPAFARLRERLDRSGIRCEACNNFFPPRVRLTGEQARLPVALEYASAAMDRAAGLGAQIIVFGSSGAKNVPPGFSQAAAWAQIVELLQQLGPLAASRGITIAIEPLNRQESNIVNRVAEGLQLVRDVGHSHVQLLLDYYHFSLEQEPLGIILEAGPKVRHVHFADPARRGFPIERDEAAAGFFAQLRLIHYGGRCSIEAYTRSFAADAPRALQVLNELTRSPTP